MNDFHTTRRYDVDWLRVLAFITLIFYHIGMFYVAEWGWHVKSEYQSVWLQNLMILVNQWRMPLIFFISGFALCMVEPKISAWKLVKIRFFRVFIPLLIGMYLIVPPQAFYEAVQQLGFGGSYLSFWLEYINPDSMLLPSMRHGDLGMLTWNHLWYLAYLWHYTLIYILIKPLLTRIGAWLKQKRLNTLVIFAIPVLILTAYGLWLKPHFPKTNALTDDWYNHAIYFTIFLFGYLAAKSEQLWNTVIRHRRYWISSAVVFYIGLLMLFRTEWIPEGGLLFEVLVQLWVYANAWTWLLSVVGFAGAYLNKPSKTLNYLNEAILPWYILHQSVTIVIAMNLAPLHLGSTLEAILVITGTFLICAILYEVIRRWSLLRFMFGMKLNSSASTPAQNTVKPPMTT